MSERSIHKSPNHLERSFERSTIFQSSTPYSTTSTVFRDDLDEKQRLEKQNFEMKMHIYHLEENLKKFQDGEHRQDVVTAATKAEVHDLKIKLEEMQIELEQRELLMVKASGVIHTLKQELDRCKESLERQDELEQKIRGLKHSNEDIAHEFRGQLIALEKESNDLRQQLMLKEQEKSQLEDRLKQTELAMAHLQDRLSDGQVDRARIEEKWLKVQEQCASLDEEVTQYRAHVDLFKIRLEEEQDEKERLKHQIKDVMQLKDAAEERHRARLIEVNNQYEAQLKTMRDRHESDMEKIRAGQVQMMSDIRDNYQQELAKKQAMMDKTLAELRTADTNEVHRSKEDFQARLDEKNEELRALRSILSTERSRIEAMITELEVTRGENREKSSLVELLRAEMQVKMDENHVLQGLRKEVQELHQKHSELLEKYRHENLDKAQWQVRCESSNKENEELRRKIAETEAELSLTKQEIVKLSYVSTELGSKTETVDHLAKDNERWKLVHNKLQCDLVEANHKNFALNKDYEYLKEDHGRIHKLYDALQEEHRQATASMEVLRVQEKENARLLQAEKEKAQRYEQALHEQRAQIIPLTRKLENLKNKNRQYTKLLQGVAQERNLFWEKLSPVLKMLHQAIRGWDHNLTSMVDGQSSTSGILNFQFNPSINGTPLYLEDNNAFNDNNNISSPQSPGLQFSLFTSSTSPRYSHKPQQHSRHKKHHSKHSSKTRNRNPQHDVYFDTGDDAEDIFVHKYHTTSSSSSDNDDYFEAEDDNNRHPYYNEKDEDDANNSVTAAETSLQRVHHRQTQQMENFRHDMAISIERVHLKLQRLGKLRQQWTSQVGQQVQQMETIHRTAQDKVALLQNKLSETQQQLSKLQTIVTRDQSQHAKEIAELHQLRDVLLAQHATQVTQYDAKIETLFLEKEKAFQEIAQQQRQIQRYQEELQSAQQQTLTLKEDIMQLESLEDGVSLLTTRLESIMSEKLLLAKDLQYVQEENKKLQVSNASYQEQVMQLQLMKDQEETLRFQLVDKCQELTDRVKRLDQDNESLKRRQIDPQLALVLMDSQQQLSHGINNNYNSNSNGHNSNNAMDRDTLLSLEERLQSLVQQIQSAVARFERIQQQYNNNNNNRYGVMENTVSLREQLDTILQEQSSLLNTTLHLLSLIKYSIQHSNHAINVNGMNNNSVVQLPVETPYGVSQRHTFSRHMHTHSNVNTNNIDPVGIATQYKLPPSSLRVSQLHTTATGGTMHIDDLSLGVAQPLVPSQRAINSNSNTNNNNNNNNNNTLSSPGEGEKEELIVFGQHNRGLFSGSSVKNNTNSLNNMTNNNNNKVMKEFKDNLEDEDAAVVADIRRRVLQISQKRINGALSNNNMTNNHGNLNVSAQNETLDQRAVKSPKLSPKSSPTYERQQSRKRLNKLDKSLQLLAKKLDSFDLAAAAAGK